jgi:hypothetical protein
MRDQPLRRWSMILLALLLTGLLPLGVPTASAQTGGVYTIFVGTALDFADSNPNDTICSTVIGGCTLRAAIQTANRRGGTATIKLQPLVYNLTIKGANEDQGATGDLDIHTNVKIVGASLNGSRSTIDAAGLGDGVIEAMDPLGLNDILVSLDTVIIRNGDARTSNASLAVAGGIFAHYGASLELNNCEVRDNIGQSLGGGIVVVANATIRNCFFVDNKTTGYEPDANFGRVDYNGGGGIAIYFGSLRIENSTIRFNHTDGNGGAIWSEGASVNLINTMVDDNDATRLGGGMYVASPIVILSNSTVSRNTANAGGGLFVARPPDENEEPDPPVQLVGFDYSVFYDNQASSFGNGVHVSLDELGHTVPIAATNSVFDQNLSANGISRNCSATTAFSNDFLFPSAYNVSSDNTCNFIDPTSKKKTPAKLTGPVKFTTTVRAFVPGPGSPLIDAIPLPCAGKDVRGVTRPQNGKCDIGAVEVVPGETVGTSVLTPAASNVQASQPFTLTLSWTHPAKWRDLSTVDLRLTADGENLPLVVRFSEGVTSTSALSSTTTITDGLLLLDSSGAVAGAGQPGSSGVLESDMATLDLAKSRFQPNGPNQQTVTLTLALRLKDAAAGKRYSVELLATQDDGTMQGPEPMGTLVVGPFSTFLPLAVR